MRNINFLKKGKQLGLTEWRSEDGKEIYFSVAVQKWNDKYMIYTLEIEREKMFTDFDDIGDYERLIKVKTIDELLNYFRNIIKVDFEELHPLKGRKIFDPKDETSIIN